MQLTDPKVIRDILEKHGFDFKKSLGQNFLINPGVCPKMAESALSLGERAVIEIGPGIGVLTKELAGSAEKVVSIELDTRLKPVLAETLAEYGNIEFIFGDIMKIDLGRIIEERFPGEKVSVCANLPYYITSPVIMKLLEGSLPITSVTVMVQKEAAERICAGVGSREAGVLTVAVNYYSRPETLFNVSRGSFVPAPNVDSSVIRLTMLDKPPVNVVDKDAFFRFVRSAFGQRRKTLINSVSSMTEYGKPIIREALCQAGLPDDIRAEKLGMDKLCGVFNRIYELQHNINQG